MIFFGTVQEITFKILHLLQKSETYKKSLYKHKIKITSQLTESFLR